MGFFVFAGQSNMGGAYQDPSSLPAAWKPDPLTFIWNEPAGAWQQMQPGVNTGYDSFHGTWGPEVQFAIDFRTQHPGEPLYILKSVDGGTLLIANAGSNDWSPTSHGELFDQTTQMIQRASAALGGQGPTALFWGQGEQDAGFPDSASYYQQDLTNFFAAVRSAWLHDQDGKIGFFRISTAPGYSAQVRAAQLAVDQADPNADSFDVANFPVQTDGLHLTNVGLDDAGDGFFQLYNNWAPGQDMMLALTSSGTLVSGPGNDTLHGAGDRAVLYGGTGDDLIFGGPGFNIVNGNQGQDTIVGASLVGDWLSGGQGNDVVTAHGPNNIVNGNLGDDTITGGSGGDFLRGGQGNDSVVAGSGAEWLSGDRGDDTLQAGSGADTIYFFAGGGHDLVLGFNAAAGDRVELAAGTGYNVSQVGSDVVVDIGGGDQLTLRGVTLSALPGGWLFSG